jgi:hypothetical protein
LRLPARLTVDREQHPGSVPGRRQP